MQPTGSGGWRVEVRRKARGQLHGNYLLVQLHQGNHLYLVPGGRYSGQTVQKDVALDFENTSATKKLTRIVSRDPTLLLS
jgi:hypothetical protein